MILLHAVLQLANLLHQVLLILIRVFDSTLFLVLVSFATRRLTVPFGVDLLLLLEVLDRFSDLLVRSLRRIDLLDEI